MSAPATTSQTTPSQNASLYVGDLPTDISEAILFDVFKAVGPVLSIRVCRDAVTRRSLGYAYVNFQNPNDAERALETLNYQPVGGRPIRIMWCHRDPGLRKSGQGNVFIKNLDPEIDNQSLYDTFSQFGNILSCKVETEAGQSKGYGFVHFETAASAEAAIEKVNGMLLSGRQVFVGKFMRRQQRVQLSTADFTNTYVKNLKPGTSEAELKTALEAFGEIASISIKEDKKGRRFGFVDFKDHTAATKAIEELHDKEHEMAEEGSNLYIQRAQKKSERQDDLRKRFAQAKAKRINDYSGHNLYVKNLDDNVTDAMLRDAFASFGEITSVKVMMDERDPPQSKGFGFVCFKDLDAANAALQQMNGRELGSKPLYVNVAQRKEVRRATLEIQYAARLGRGVAAPGGAPGGPGGFPGAPYGFAPGAPGAMPYGMGARGIPAQKGGWPGNQPGVPYGAAGGMPGGMRPQPARRGPAGMAGGPPGVRAGMAPYNYPPRGPGGVGGMRPGVPPMNIPPGAAGGANPALPGQNYAFTKQARNQVIGVQGANVPAVAPVQPSIPGGQKLTTATLANMSLEQQKNTLGERLFARINETHPDHAAKITGMLLEMDISEQLNLLESPDSLNAKIMEALEVLHVHGGGES